MSLRQSGSPLAASIARRDAVIGLYDDTFVDHRNHAAQDR